MRSKTKVFELRRITAADWDEVSRLICDSTNGWYEAHGFGKIFQNGPESTRLFCEVYEALDPGCCVLAIDPQGQCIAGSCFFHPRVSHVSLGIMNVHPEFFGLGIASQLLEYVVRIAEEASLPIRLVSSAMNLDSFSLYSRAGFVPQVIYQDLLMAVPESGLDWQPRGVDCVRDAVLADVDKIVSLEMELGHISRERDIRFFIENQSGIWHISVFENEHCELFGYLASVNHPGSNMIGPGIARDGQVAAALIAKELDQHRGCTPVLLLPSAQRELVRQLYVLGARNCELHFGQVRGEVPLASGVVMPTFMPETG